MENKSNIIINKNKEINHINNDQFNAINMIEDDDVCYNNNKS